MNVTQVIFSFPEEALESLDKMTHDVGLSTAQTVSESLRFARLVQKQVANGFTELVLRDPRTGDEVIITPPFAS